MKRQFALRATPRETVIDWPTRAVPSALAHGVVKYYRTRARFAQPDDAELRRLAGEFRPLTRAQVRAIGSVTMAQLAIECAPRITRELPALAAEYAGGDDIVDIASRHGIPPVATLRAILVSRGQSGATVHDAFTGRTDPARALSAHDMVQLSHACACDDGSAARMREIGAVAAHEEARFVAALRTLGLQLKTQDDLAREQTAQYGRAVSTPDVLLTAPVVINGTRIYWIDFKAYLLVPGTFIVHSLVRQAAKYTQRYGAGAFVFLYGYTDVPAVVRTGAMLLHAQSLYEYVDDAKK